MPGKFLKHWRRRLLAPRHPDHADATPATAQLPPSPGNGATAGSETNAPHSLPSEPGKVPFHALGLPPAILQAIAELGFRHCTPIQALVIPAALEGRDIAGRAQTGTGKTAAFLLSIFTRFLRQPLPRPLPPGAPRALILAPTRELAVQIEKDARALGRHTDFKTLAVYGGMDYQKQRRDLQTVPVDILVATPGRLLDYRRRGHLDLRRVEVLVIDEADRMLDMGFIPDVRTIVHATPPKDRRQTMLFSATLTPAITRLAAAWMRDPLRAETAPEKLTVDTVEQVVFTVPAHAKFALFYNLLQREKLDRVLMFCNRRDETARVLRLLRRYGVNAAMLSGAVPQEKRLATLEAFRAGRIRVLVATDVAGRGLHVEAISHVINYDIPYDPEDYVHRIGRTARAGASGRAYTFACENESFSLPDIEAFLGQPLTYRVPEPDWLRLPPPPHVAPDSSDSRSAAHRRRRSPGAESPPAGGPGLTLRSGPAPGCAPARS